MSRYKLKDLAVPPAPTALEMDLRIRQPMPDDVKIYDATGHLVAIIDKRTRKRVNVQRTPGGEKVRRPHV